MPVLTPICDNGSAIPRPFEQREAVFCAGTAAPPRYLPLFRKHPATVLVSSLLSPTEAKVDITTLKYKICTEIQKWKKKHKTNG